MNLYILLTVHTTDWAWADGGGGWGDGVDTCWGWWACWEACCRDGTTLVGVGVLDTTLEAVDGGGPDCLLRAPPPDPRRLCVCVC